MPRNASADDLKNRVAATLQDDSVSSGAVQGLIDEAAAALESVNIDLAAAANKALDPLLDAKSAAEERQRGEKLQFESARWTAALTPLRETLLRARGREKAVRDEARYYEVAKEHAALVADLQEQYPAAAQTIATLLARMALMDRLTRGLPTPAGEPRLLPVETAARGGFAVNIMQTRPSLMDAALPAFETTGPEFVYHFRGR